MIGRETTIAGMAHLRLRGARGEQFARHARPIARRRVDEEIVERIEAMLVAGNLEAGDQLLAERELMPIFEVGRTSVREALFALQRRGVVPVQSGERATVTTPNAEGVVADLCGAVLFYMATEQGECDFRRRAPCSSQLLRAMPHGSRAMPRWRRPRPHWPPTNGRSATSSASSISTSPFITPSSESSREPDHRCPATGVGRLAARAAPGVDHAAWLGAGRGARPSPDFRSDRGARPHAAAVAMQAHLAEVERFYWEPAARAGRTAREPASPLLSTEA
jgi:GntR family transcriptional regulator, sialic acid-inducible nan operon repressor